MVNIPPFSGEVLNISALPDQPTCTAQELKAWFDKAGLDLKTWINGTLLPGLSQENAGMLPFTPTEELPYETVQEALSQLGLFTAFQAAAKTITAGMPATVEKETDAFGRVKLTFGIPKGERGTDGAAISLDGFFSLYVDENQHLKLVANSANVAEAFSIDQNPASETYGHLLYTVQKAEGEAKEYDLGSVMGQGMTATVYDPTGKQEDIFAYADRMICGDFSLLLIASSWDNETKTITVTMPGFDADSKYDIGIREDATDEQCAAWDRAYIRMEEKRAGSFVLRAKNTVPSIDIPILVRIYP